MCSERTLNIKGLRIFFLSEKTPFSEAVQNNHEKNCLPRCVSVHLEGKIRLAKNASEMKYVYCPFRKMFLAWRFILNENILL